MIRVALNPGGFDMSDIDFEYYETRLRVEQRAAELAQHPGAARSHARLAEVYAGLLRAANENQLLQ